MSGLLDNVLPWLYSTGNQAKKQVRGLLEDPRAFVGSIGQDLQTQQDERRKALGTLLNPGVFTTPQEQSAAQNALTNEAMNLLGITVYHGSPHKFDKFDASKIGTGEGAQAYGHGLYFAESPKVAGAYQKQLTSGARGWEYDGKLADSLPMEQRNLIESFLDKTKYKGMSEAEALVALKSDAVNGLAQAEKNLREARANLGKTLDMGEEWGKLQFFTYGPEHIASAEKSLEQMRRHLAEVERLKPGAIKANEGALYKVDLPDSAIEKMLDWDKPLSQQAEAVRVAAMDLGLPSNATGKDFYNALANHRRDMAIIRGNNAKTTLPEMQSAASDELRGFGIPGIRYLDAGSRGAGKGSYNYVVFPGGESQLKILERNGKGLLDR